MAPGRGKTKLRGQLSVSPRKQCRDFLIGAVPIGGAALFVAAHGVPVIQRGGDGLFTQPVHGDGSDDLRVLAADLLPGAC